MKIHENGNENFKVMQFKFISKNINGKSQETIIENDLLVSK